MNILYYNSTLMYNSILYRNNFLNDCLTNTEYYCYKVPPPKDIHDAIMKSAEKQEEEEGAVAEQKGIKRERDEDNVPTSTTTTASKRSKLSVDDTGYGESGSEHDTSLDTKGSVMPRDFAMPSVETEIPGLEELMSSESKWSRGFWFLFDFFRKNGKLLTSRLGVIATTFVQRMN